MILDFDTFCLNEKHTSLRLAKKVLRGVLSGSDRAEMKKILRHNIVLFKFQKRDGSIRKAKGTLYHSYLPPLRGGGPKPEHQMVYYDLDKHHWRSFRSFKFIKILDIKQIGKDKEKEDEEEMKKKLPEPEEKEIKKDKDIHKEVDKEDVHKKHIEKDVDKHDEHKEKPEDEKKKTFKAGEKMSEKELLRRSTDFRKDSKKNKLTKKANDAYKKGELDDDNEDDKKDKKETEE